MDEKPEVRSQKQQQQKQFQQQRSPAVRHSQALSGLGDADSLDAHDVRTGKAPNPFKI